MSHPHPAFRPPCNIRTTDIRIWPLLNSYQMLYMSGLIESDDFHPDALSVWYHHQSRHIDLGLHSQNLLLERGFQLQEISRRDSVASLTQARQQRSYPGRIHRLDREATPRDLDLLLHDGWLVIAREFGGTEDIGVVFYGRDGSQYLAYHPVRGPITVSHIMLFRYDTMMLQAWCPSEFSLM